MTLKMYLKERAKILKAEKKGKPLVQMTRYRNLHGYKLCPECGQPLLKQGQERKEPGDYRHAVGCSKDDEDAYVLGAPNAATRHHQSLPWGEPAPRRK